MSRYFEYGVLDRGCENEIENMRWDKSEWGIVRGVFLVGAVFAAVEKGTIE